MFVTTTAERHLNKILGNRWEGIWSNSPKHEEKHDKNDSSKPLMEIHKKHDSKLLKFYS